jgi:acetyl esterase/lipase
VLPRYRLAPEHPFPAAHEDATNVALHVAGRGDAWLGGDSAGGNLALGACAEMLARGMRPKGLLLVSPAPDLDLDRDPPEGSDEMLLPFGMLRRAVAAYLGPADATDPRVSPLHAAFPDPPPTLIQLAAGEVMEPDIDKLAEHLRAQGGRVRVEKARGLPHDYQVMTGLSPAADRAVDRLAAFLRHTR